MEPGGHDSWGCRRRQILVPCPAIRRQQPAAVLRAARPVRRCDLRLAGSGSDRAIVERATKSATDVACSAGQWRYLAVISVGSSAQVTRAIRSSWTMTVNAVVTLTTRRSQVQILPPPPKGPGQKHLLARSCRVRMQPTATRHVLTGAVEPSLTHEPTTRHEPPLPVAHRECAGGCRSPALLRLKNPKVEPGRSARRRPLSDTERLSVQILGRSSTPAGGSSQSGTSAATRGAWWE